MRVPITQAEKRAGQLDFLFVLIQNSPKKVGALIGETSC